jgi:hypothetical protein
MINVACQEAHDGLPDQRQEELSLHDAAAQDNPGWGSYKDVVGDGSSDVLSLERPERIIVRESLAPSAESLLDRWPTCQTLKAVGMKGAGPWKWIPNPIVGDADVPHLGVV